MVVSFTYYFNKHSFKVGLNKLNLLDIRKRIEIRIEENAFITRSTTRKIEKNIHIQCKSIACDPTNNDLQKLLYDSFISSKGYKTMTSSK